MLQNRTIVVGIAGGIAAYKAAAFVHRLRKEGARVVVIMTEHAGRFITPLTLQSLSGGPVWTGLVPPGGSGLKDLDPQAAAVPHVKLAEEADLLAVVPATANVLGKFAHGIADDFLSTFYLSLDAPVLVAPSMEETMYRSPAVQANLTLLKSRGVKVLEPERGRLASGAEGLGRLPEPDHIFAAVVDHLTREGRWQGRRVLVTAGPTREHLDEVRFLSNPSSGRMGFAMAQAARWQGADVHLVTGPTALPTPYGVQRTDVESAAEMLEAVRSRAAASDWLFMAAAVADYRPAARLPGKRKKDESGWQLELTRTEDILAALSGHGALKRVGFAAEVEDVEAGAAAKIQAKDLDYVVANRVGAPDRGFAAATNAAVLLSRDGRRQSFPLTSKEALAAAILETMAAWEEDPDPVSGAVERHSAS